MGVFLGGIGLASVKQLVAVDIGFTLLALCWDPHQRLSWGSFFLGIGLALVNLCGEHGGSLIDPFSGWPPSA